MSITERTCLRCGRVHFAVSREAAEKSVREFNAYFDTLTKKQQKDYYGGEKSKIEDYEHCMMCSNPYSHFRPAKEGDCPDGCTLSPIIFEEPPVSEQSVLSQSPKGET